MRWLAPLLLLAAAGCADGDSDTDGICDDVTPSTWASFGQDFVQENCQACHSGTSSNRYNAPPAVNFDFEDEVRERADRVLTRVEEGSMPPQGGISEDDKQRLADWLTCGS